MSLLPDDIDAALVRYFAGQLSESERIAFEAWIAEDAARREEVERLRAVWTASAAATAAVGDEPDTEQALARVKQQAAARSGRRAAERPVLRLEVPRRQRTRAATYAWRIAAAVVIALSAGTLWRFGPSLQDPAADTSPIARTYATARAERATLTLPDGSTVMLNNESTLELPVSFGGCKAGGCARDVYLRGEGYFEVARDTTRPFRVHAAGAVTEVLGTKFGVRARGGEEAVQVAVAEGKVAVRGARAPAAAQAILTAGHLGRVDPGGAVAVRSGVDVERYLGWTDSRLVFERTPLPEVLAELSRWYDRDFVPGDSALAALRLTTRLHGASLLEAVKVLETALEVRARVDGRQVILERR